MLDLKIEDFLTPCIIFIYKFVVPFIVFIFAGKILSIIDELAIVS